MPILCCAWREARNDTIKLVLSSLLGNKQFCIMMLDWMKSPGPKTQRLWCLGFLRWWQNNVNNSFTRSARNCRGITRRFSSSIGELAIFDEGLILQDATNSLSSPPYRCTKPQGDEITSRKVLIGKDRGGCRWNERMQASMPPEQLSRPLFLVCFWVRGGNEAGVCGGQSEPKFRELREFFSSGFKRSASCCPRGVFQVAHPPGFGLCGIGLLG